MIKNTQSFYVITLLMINVIYFSGCRTMMSVSLEGSRASTFGFTKEFDEPSVRGALSRISPEGIHVMGRFCISPDETSIVISGYHGKYTSISDVRDLWRIQVAGGAPVKITSGSESDFRNPSFTENGEYIVYESDGHLWKIRQDGAGGKQRIPGTGTDNDYGGHVSSDNRIVFGSLVTRNNVVKSIIWTCNMDGGELTQLREGKYPMWSPDGRKITFTFDEDIWVINTDGTELTQLTSTKDEEEVLPSFSKNGSKITYASNIGSAAGSDYNIWIMNLDGSEQEQLTELESWDSWPVMTDDEIFFLSARGAAKASEKRQRIWRLKIR